MKKLFLLLSVLSFTAYPIQLSRNPPSAAVVESDPNSLHLNGDNAMTGNINLNGATSGTLSIGVPAVVTSHGLVFPAAQGAADTFLKNDGSGNLSWAASAGGITGSGVANQVTYWTGAGAIGGDTGMTFVPGSDELNLGAAGSVWTNLGPNYIGHGTLSGVGFFAYSVDGTVGAKDVEIGTNTEAGFQHYFGYEPGDTGISYNTWNGASEETLVSFDRLAANTLNLLWGTDNTGNIGALGANRPATGYFGTSVVVGSTVTITSNTVSTPIGSSSSASHTFNGDPNTGMFSGGADDLQLTAGGVTQMRMFGPTVSTGIEVYPTAAGGNQATFNISGIDTPGNGTQLQISNPAATYRQILRGSSFGDEAGAMGLYNGSNYTWSANLYKGFRIGDTGSFQNWPAFSVKPHGDTASIGGTATAAGTTVTGSGTKFLYRLAVGDRISLDGGTTLATVTSISSDTSLTTDVALTGTSQPIYRRILPLRIDDRNGNHLHSVSDRGQIKNTPAGDIGNGIVNYTDVNGLTNWNILNRSSGTLAGTNTKNINWQSYSVGASTSGLNVNRVGVDGGSFTGYSTMFYTTVSTPNSTKGLSLYNAATGGNIGHYTGVQAGSSGGSIAYNGYAADSNWAVGLNVGALLGVGTSPKTWGVRSLATQDGSAQSVAVYGRLNATATTESETRDPGVSAAAIFDNGNTTADILNLRDNNVLRMNVTDGGHMQLFDTASDYIDFNFSPGSDYVGAQMYGTKNHFWVQSLNQSTAYLHVVNNGTSNNFYISANSDNSTTFRTQGGVNPIYPGSNNGQDFGGASLQWKNIYAGTQFLGPSGSSSVPSYSFSSSTGSGMYLSGTDQLGFSTAGGIRLSIENDSIWFRQGPEVAIWNDVDSNRVFRMFAASGANEGLMQITTANGRIENGDGTAAIPAYSFFSSGRQDNGMYLAGGDVLGFSAGGVDGLRVDSSGDVILQGLTGSTGQLSFGPIATTGKPYQSLRAGTTTKLLVHAPDNSTGNILLLTGSSGASVEIDRATSRVTVSGSEGMVVPVISAAVATPVAGAIVFDTNNSVCGTNKHCGYDGTTWNALY